MLQVTKRTSEIYDKYLKLFNNLSLFYLQSYKYQ